MVQFACRDSAAEANLIANEGLPQLGLTPTKTPKAPLQALAFKSAVRWPHSRLGFYLLRLSYTGMALDFKLGSAYPYLRLLFNLSLDSTEAGTFLT